MILHLRVNKGWSIENTERITCKVLNSIYDRVLAAEEPITERFLQLGGSRDKSHLKICDLFMYYGEGVSVTPRFNNYKVLTKLFIEGYR